MPVACHLQRRVCRTRTGWSGTDDGTNRMVCRNGKPRMGPTVCGQGLSGQQPESIRRDLGVFSPVAGVKAPARCVKPCHEVAAWFLWELLSAAKPSYG